jgi:hypothetical protein
MLVGSPIQGAPLADQIVCGSSMDV